MSGSETSTATQPIPDAELGEIEENLRAGHEYTDSTKLDEADLLQNDLVGREWELALAELRARAKTSKLNAAGYRRLLARYRRLLDRIYEALHENRYRSEKENVPRYFWQRQQFDLLHFDDETRGFSIFKESLLEAAAWYLSEPDLRTSRADWVFLDAIIFCELELVADEVFTRRSGTGFNWALVLASRKPWIYIALMPVFWLLGLALRFLALPVSGGVEPRDFGGGARFLRE